MYRKKSSSFDKKNFSVGGYVEALPFSHYFES
jgi:predicted secreted Zn-dependent protease